MKNVFIIVFGCCLFYYNSFSQELFSRQISLDHDNPSIKYNTIFFEANGLMLIGTSHGLYQYDGIDYLAYTLPDKSSENDVTAIMQDKSKTIWTGYKSGKIACLTNDSLILFNPAEGLPAKQITAMLQDKQGNIWFATSGEGVYFYSNKRLYNINEDDGLNHNHAYCLTEDNSGNIWVGTDQGIAVCKADVKNKIIKKFTYDDGLPDEIVTVLQKDITGNIWVGTQDKGICKFDIKLNKIVVPIEFQNWQYGQVNSMIISDMECWIGTEENGVISYNPAFKVFTKYAAFGNSKINKINQILKDNEGNLWCASNNELINSQGNTLIFYNQIKNQKINFVHSILCSRNNEIYFTPDSQLVMITESKMPDAMKYFAITTPGKLIDIVSLFEDACGYIWIGTMGEGVFRFNPETGKKQKIAGYNALEKSSVLSINGNENEIWFATLEGAIRCTIDGNCNKDDINYTFTGYEKQKEIGNYFIYKIFVDSRKRIWFGTDGKGLVVLDKNIFTNYGTKQGLESNAVYSITEDNDKNIWCSTDYGIYKFNGATFTNYNLTNGLRELVSTSIFYDGNGNIINTHIRGIDLLNIKTGVVHYLNFNHTSEEINTDLNSITSDVQRNIWIGTEKGIVKFNSQFKNFKAKPISLIKKVTLLTDNSKLSNGVKLGHNQNNISVDFAGIWFTDPDLVKYQYRLAGYDKDWITTKDRKIFFSNLAPGTYTFNLKSTACNNFDIASETSFLFTINKPFWDEIWFRIMAILLLASAAYIFLRIRDKNIERLHALEKEKIKFQFETLKSQVNPHFLFNSFNTLISIIEKDKSTAVEYVENLSEYFRNLIYYRDKDVIPLEEELKLSSSYYFLQQKRFGNSLRVIIEVDKNKNQFELPPLVVQILMENAIKHNAISKETPLVIEITTTGNKLIIQNNINKKNSVEKSTGTGIKNIIARYELLTKDKVEILKTETDFIVTIPLIKKEVQ